jgi:transposase InsO family protein
VRSQHPVWGGRKIRRVLLDDGVGLVPSASTITAILRRHGLLEGPRSGQPREWTRYEHAEPNDLWQMDFKGHFAMEAGRCHPLTVLDDHSRYALAIGACDNERTGTVRGQLERIFARYGLPRRILADNGPPWGTAGSSERHTALTVWLLDLDVAVVHGRPYHPQTQGKDERFHRTLKGEVLDGRHFRTLEEAQAAFDAWRHIYNTRRPHEALAMATPVTRYKPSPRTMPDTIAPPNMNRRPRSARSRPTVRSASETTTSQPRRPSPESMSPCAQPNTMASSTCVTAATAWRRSICARQ